MLSAHSKPQTQPIQRTKQDIVSTVFMSDDEEDTEYQTQQETHQQDSESDQDNDQNSDNETDSTKDEPLPIIDNEEDEDDAIPFDEVRDIVMESAAMRDEKVLRSGKMLEGYRSVTIMDEFKSEDEEDQDFVEGTSDNDDSEEDEVEEEEDSVTPEEVHHIAYDAATAMGSKMKHERMLKSGKIVGNVGGDMDTLVSKINQMMDVRPEQEL